MDGFPIEGSVLGLGANRVIATVTDCLATLVTGRAACADGIVLRCQCQRCVMEGECDWVTRRRW